MSFFSFQSCLNSANDELYEIIRIDTIPAFLGVFKGLRNPDGAEGTGSPPRTHVDDPVIHKYSEGIENADTPEISISNECLSYTDAHVTSANQELMSLELSTAMFLQ